MRKLDFSSIHNSPFLNIFLSEPLASSFVYQCYHIEIVWWPVYDLIILKGNVKHEASQQNYETVICEAICRYASAIYM